MSEKLPKSAFPFRDEDQLVCPFHTDGRPNIGPAIRHVQENGWPDARNLDPRPGADYHDPAEIKTALYVAAAPITLDIVTTALDNRALYPPLGLVRRGTYDASIGGYPEIPILDFAGNRPFASLSNALKDTLGRAADKNQHAFIHKDKTPEASTVYDAYETLSYWRTGSTGELTGRGLNTGTGSSTNLLEVIKPVAQRNFSAGYQSSELYETIARRSYSLIKALARDDLRVATTILKELQDNKGSTTNSEPFNPHYFDLSNSLDLTLTSSFEEKIRNKYGFWLGERKALGCPVIHTKALYLLWSWEVELARNIWEKQLEADQAL